MTISYERDTLGDEERARLWDAINLQHFRMLLANEAPDTRSVVEAIVAASPRAITTREVADASGVPFDRIASALAQAHRLAAIVHEVPHKSGAVPWNLGENDDGDWTYQCPERVAKALR